MLRFLIIFALFLLVTFVLVRVLETRLVFFPSKYPIGNWHVEHFGFKPEDVWFVTPDSVKIHAWFIKHERPVAHFLMAHGNAGNLSDRSQLLAFLNQTVPANLLMVDYRGYGRSEGSPSEEGCYLDAEAAFDWLHENAKTLPIIAHGHSLGCAVVIELAGRRQLDGLILESAFTNAGDMARLMFGPVPLHWLSTMKWENDAKLASLKIPKLFLHGDRDSVVPYELGRKLYQAAAKPKEFVTLHGADHNDLFSPQDENYYGSIRGFVVSCATAAHNEQKEKRG